VLGLGKVGPRVWDAVFITVGFWVLALSLWMDVRVGGAILERISTASMGVHADFDSFWRSARALLAGDDVYNTGARLVNLNPPVWTVLISPLAVLPVLTAYRVFVVISLVVSVGYLAWTAEEVRLGPAWAVVGGALLLLSSPLLSTLALGQVYPMLALGLVAAWMADRRGRQGLSGGALGLVVALKPSLLPVLLWPVVRRRWRAFGAALAAGAAATLVGVIAAGPRATLDYIGILSDGSASPYWDNASLPGGAARLFTDNPYAEHAATLPWTIYVAYALGIGAVVLTAIKVQRDQEAGLWALVAASLLASPIAWHNYLVLLGPGVLLLLARGRAGLAFLLLALQSIPAQWPLLWNDRGTVAASLAMTLYLYILVAHWLVFLAATGETDDDTEPVSGGVKRPADSVP
jgi:alpha-1,2-mannosyltransferase